MNLSNQTCFGANRLVVLFKKFLSWVCVAWNTLGFFSEFNELNQCNNKLCFVQCIIWVSPLNIDEDELLSESGKKYRFYLNFVYSLHYTCNIKFYSFNALSVLKRGWGSGDKPPPLSQFSESFLSAPLKYTQNYSIEFQLQLCAPNRFCCGVKGAPLITFRKLS